MDRQLFYTRCLAALMTFFFVYGGEVAFWYQGFELALVPVTEFFVCFAYAVMILCFNKFGQIRRTMKRGPLFLGVVVGTCIQFIVSDILEIFAPDTSGHLWMIIFWVVVSMLPAMGFLWMVLPLLKV